jgi:hypothetical protein
MDIAYYFIGLLTGVSVSTFLSGKNCINIIQNTLFSKKVGSNIEVK